MGTTGHMASRVEIVFALGSEIRRGVQYRRAMAVEGALGMTGRAGSIAKRGGGALVELGPLDIRGLGGEQLS